MSRALPLTASDIRLSAASIAREQQRDGAIPWFDGEHIDPWDHVQAAMALTAAGLLTEAQRAYRFASDSQRGDGSWPMRVVQTTIADAAADTNQCAYIAVGSWHYWLATSDMSFLQGIWPMLDAAMEFVLSLQRPGGEVAWAASADGRIADEALLAGNCSIYQALRCAAAIGEVLGRTEQRWEIAASKLGHALRRHPELFADKSRYSMDWYYPVLSGAVRGPAGSRHITARWADFVEPGWGIRCVADQPWVTGAETCELVLALDACGDTDRALQLFTDVQHLRHSDGSYWTGLVLDDKVIWPHEQTTWTAATVILAYDALTGTSPASGLFRGFGLGPVPAWTGCDCSSLVGQR